jgi:hypothetical protein
MRNLRMFCGALCVQGKCELLSPNCIQLRNVLTARVSLFIAVDRRAVFGRVTSAGELILAHFVLGKVNVFNSAA